MQRRIGKPPAAPRFLDAPGSGGVGQVFVLVPFIESGASGRIGDDGADDEKTAGMVSSSNGRQVPLHGNLFWLASKSLNPRQTWSGFRR
jgi:hypothetical protein